MKNFVAASLLFLMCLTGMAQGHQGARKYPSLLWEITGNGLKSPSYLFGTMHVSSKMAFHLSDSFYNSLRSVDIVALELDPLRWQDQLYVLQDRQKKLRRFSQQAPGAFISEKSFRLLPYEADLKRALGEEPVVLNSLLYRTYRQESDFEEDTYLDLYIFQTARKMGKRSTGVEDFFQTEKLIMEAYQDMAREKKKKTADQENDPASELEKKTQEAYRKGDLDQLDSLEKLMQRSDAFMEKFMFVRNEIQAHSIDTILRKNTLFVGVGAAHLPGRRGVIELLRKKGYELRPVFMQDRDARQKDEIDQMKVPVKFERFAEEQGLFMLEAPGKMYRKEDVQRNMGWQYADMSNGTYYSATRVFTNANITGFSEEMVLKKLDSMLYESIPGKIVSSNAVELNGYKGRMVVNRTRRGDLQQYKILVTPFEVWIFKMSGPGDYVSGKEGAQFFSSIQIPGKNTAGWKKIAPERGGFSVVFPSWYVMVQKGESVLPNGRVEYAGTDPLNGNGYAIWKKTLHQFSFLEEDSFHLGMMEESFKRGERISKTISRKQGYYSGQPCISAHYQLEDGSFVQAKFLSKGNDFFVLIARAKNKDAAHESFFNGFSFVPYRYETFQTYSDTILQIQVKVPAVPDVDQEMRSLVHQSTTDEFLNSIPDYFDYQAKSRFAMFEDEGTGEGVFVSLTEFPRYYYSKDTAAFWSSELREKRIQEDLLIVSKKPVARNNGATGYMMVLADTNTRKQIRLMALLQQNRLYRVVYSSDSAAVSPYADTFFETFQPNDVKGEKKVTDHKSALFFSDYRSRDSATRKRAAEAIQYVYFGPNDVDSITSVLSQLKYGEKDYLLKKSKFIRELGYIRDSSAVPKVVRTLDVLFHQSGDTTAVQNAVLDALASNRSAQSYALLKKVLRENPPVYETDYEYIDFFGKLSDSLALTAGLFPDLLDLSAIQDYKPHIHELLIQLCDSGFVKPADYKRYFPQMYVDARMELKKLQVGDEKRMDEEENENNNTDEEDVTLLPVYSYARLLSPFYHENNNVQLFFKRLLEVRDMNIKVEIASLMLKQKLPIPDSMFAFLASKNISRAKWYRVLEKEKMTAQFPALYKKQVELSRSLLLENEGFEQFHAVEMVGRTWVSMKGKAGWVYFFKYKLLPDDEWQMGLAGLQPKNEKEVSAKGELVRLTRKKIKPTPSVEEQFQNQLIRLVYANRQSAQNFFEDYDNY